MKPRSQQAVFVLALLFTSFGRSDSTLNEGGPDPGGETTEYKLAVVDGAAVSPDDPAVQDDAAGLLGKDV